MICTKCSNETIPNQSLCTFHFKEYWEEIWCDNSDIDNLGIVRWANYHLPEYARDNTPTFHKEAYIQLFQLLDPFYTKQIQRQVQFVWFREAGKSAVLAIYVMFLLTHNQKKIFIKGVRGEKIEVTVNERLIAIISETGPSSEEFVKRLRDEFPSNEKFKWFYPYIFKEVELDERIAKNKQKNDEWRMKSFAFNGCAVLGLGAKQQIRGKVKGAYRATMAIFDDIYSENTVKTEESRRGTRIWFERSAINSIDSIMGKVIAVNTIVHEDTVTVDNMKNPQWKNIFVPIMPIEKFKKFISEHLFTDKVTGTVRLKYDEIKDEVDRIEKQTEYYRQVQESEDWGLAWKERRDLYFLALKYQSATFSSGLSGLYQEFFHEILSEESKRFKSHYFQYLEFDLIKEYGNTFIKSELHSEPTLLNIEFGVDLSAGTTDGDEGVIAVVGTTWDGRRYVIDIVAGKFDHRDDLYNKNNIDRYGYVEMDRSNIKKIGMMDEIIRQMAIHEPSRIKIGVAGEEVSFVNEMRKLLNSRGTYVTLTIRQQTKQGGSKHERIANTLLTPFQSYLYYIRNTVTKNLQHQLEFLTSAANDDKADALECAEYRISLPAKMVLNDYKPEEKKYSKFHPMFESTKQKVFDWRTM